MAQITTEILHQPGKNACLTTPRSRRKRDALLQSALALFAERGYEGTSIEDIAHHAGVAVGSFYQHFASKRQILLVLMDRLLQEASMLTLEAKSAALPDIRNSITRLVCYELPDFS